MKKSLFFLLSSLVLGTIYGQQISASFVKVDPESVPQLKKIIEGSEFKNLINSNNFSVGDVYLVTSDQNYVFWAIEISQSASSSQYILAIYPDGSIFDQLLLKLSVDGNRQRLIVTNISDGVTVGDALVNTGSPNPPPPSIRTCREEHPRFNDCMECAVKRLIDDWVGIITCGVQPLLCAAAAIVHCGRPRLR